MALFRACYVLRFLLADRADLRQAYYKHFGRVAIIPYNNTLNTIPEYLPVHHDFSVSCRGLGAIPMAPVSTAGEENILCYEEDTYNEDVLIREIAQGIFHLAATSVEPGITNHVTRIYDSAMESGWWDNTYAEHSPAAYFVSGRQLYVQLTHTLCNNIIKPPPAI